MRVGVSLTSAQPGNDARQGARWMIERAAAARDAGLDSLFVGDHHATPGAYYQNVAIMGRLLAEWDDRPAGCLFLLPLWNPVLLAEQVGTLASIARGPFVMQCALGAGRQQFSAMGANEKTRPSAFEESLDIIRRLWAGQTVSSGHRFTFEKATCNPRPPEPVDVWIGGSAEASIDRAARLGEAWLAGPELTFEQAQHWVDFYRERCKVHNRIPTAIAIRRDVYIGESASDVEAVAGPIVASGYRGFEPSALSYGTPDEVAARFRDYAAMGYTDVIIRHLTNDHDKILGSYRRLGEVRRAVLEA